MENTPINTTALDQHTVYPFKLVTDAYIYPKLHKVRIYHKMAPEVVSKIQSLVTGESKSARKKKAKADSGSTAVPAAREQTASDAGAGSSEAPSKANGTDSDNAYVRELQK